jgi:hypothetical protein
MMTFLYRFIGFALMVISIRFALDAASHLTAAVAMSGLMIAGGLFVVAAEIAGRAAAERSPILQPTRPAPAPSDQIKFDLGGPVR